MSIYRYRWLLGKNPVRMSVCYRRGLERQAGRSPKTQTRRSIHQTARRRPNLVLRMLAGNLPKVAQATWFYKNLTAETLLYNGWCCPRPTSPCQENLFHASA